MKYTVRDFTKTLLIVLFHVSKHPPSIVQVQQSTIEGTIIHIIFKFTFVILLIHIAIYKTK